MGVQMTRAEQGIQVIANEILNEAYHFQVSPYRVMDQIKRAVDNKMKSVRAANPENADELMELMRHQMTSVQPVNCKCYSLGVWAGVVEPQKIIYSGNRTIVLWNDGTKTIVKVAKGQEFDEYLGFIAAYAKKMFGTNSKIKKLIKAISSRPEPKKAKKSDDTEN